MAAAKMHFFVESTLVASSSGDFYLDYVLRLRARAGSKEIETSSDVQCENVKVGSIGQQGPIALSVTVAATRRKKAVEVLSFKSKPTR